MKLLKIQLVIFTCVLIITSSYCQTANEILDRYLDTVSNGDVDKWDKIKSLYSTSISYFSSEAFQFGKRVPLDARNISYKKMYIIWPDKRKEELYEDSLCTGNPSKFYFLKDKHVILLNNSAVSGMPPVETKVIKSVWFDFYPTKIKNYIKQSKSISFNGKKEIPGRSSVYFEVAIETKENTNRLLFNTKTYLLEAISFPERNQYWIISDYKFFDGYLIPTSLTDMINGIIVSWQTYKSFEFNIPIDIIKFTPPN